MAAAEQSSLTMERGAGGDDYEAFVALHGPALSASGVPPRYWPSLWRKLEGEVGAEPGRKGGGDTCLARASSSAPRPLGNERPAGRGEARRSAAWRSRGLEPGRPLD